MDSKLYQTNPRAFALDLVNDGLVSCSTLLTMALNYLSHDDCREMLDMNELSPRFDADKEDEPDNDDDTEN